VKTSSLKRSPRLETPDTSDLFGAVPTLAGFRYAPGVLTAAEERRLVQ
jgi:hypothetical protein